MNKISLEERYTGLDSRLLKILDAVNPNDTINIMHKQDYYCPKSGGILIEKRKTELTLRLQIGVKEKGERQIVRWGEVRIPYNSIADIRYIPN
ncbi:hypothetical protein K8R33_03125 [archaeon]|nr:hypothetical protein [archaeon]